MPYKFTQNANYEDYSPGRVLLQKPGAPNFPVRLASEIFLRCLAYTSQEKVSIYDPCCGSGYLLTVLGFLHGEKIAAIYGSDISDEALEIAKINLQLLNSHGARKREAQLLNLYRTYGKNSHMLALESAKRLALLQTDIKVELFRHDILQAQTQPQVDIVIADIPYGQLCEAFPPEDMLQNLQAGIIAISSSKSQKIAAPKHRRLEKFQLGKRKIEILRPE